MAFVRELVSLSNTPLGEEFLSKKEFEKYGSLKFEKRRINWLGGRFSAKKAVVKALCLKDISLKDIEILNDADRKPYFTIKGKMYPNVLSLSHCAEYAISAVGTGENSLLGIDMEIIEARPKSWVLEVFNPNEISGNETPSVLTEMWTKKESVLKALGIGLAADLHQLVIVKNNPVFLGELFEIWKKKGGKKITIESYNKVKGYIISVAYDF